jgi:RNAse (barnase) inhibitor barstar
MFCKFMRPEVIIDANQFSDLAGFAEQFNEVALRGQHRWSGNLNAFNDILRGGFGTPEGGFTVVWLNHQKSRRDLAQLFDALVDIIRIHGSGGEEEEDRIDLKLQ